MVKWVRTRCSPRLAVIVGIGAAIAVVGVATAGAAATPSGPTDKPGVEAAYASLAAVSPAPKLGAAAPASPDVTAQPVFVVPTHSATWGTIVDSTLGPPGSVGTDWANDWTVQTPTQILEVYAGALSADPAQGVVVIARWDPTHAAWLGGGRLLVPSAIGGVTITDAANGVVTLHGSLGLDITLDPLTGAFR